jgi:hypothetical protein
MPPFLTQTFGAAPVADPWQILARLLAALVLGSVVAWVYARTTRGEESAASLPTTLVLLAVLIAMVTQVIGDNVARAFSLVGALSIVRFRTVVRDTRDTAFVIFAVVVGMAVGSQNLWVACLGILVVAAASFLLAWREASPAAAGPTPAFTLRLRAGVSVELQTLLTAELPGARLRLISLSTAKQGTSLDAAYELHIPTGISPEELVKKLHRIEGIYDVRLTAPGSEPE